MDEKRSTLIQYGIILILGIAITAIIVYILVWSSLNQDLKFTADLTIADNPLMGYAPDARNEELCERANLVFILLTWEEWEPSDGMYDIDGLERRCNLDKWRSEGKHAILRFVCDVPGESDHTDIPGWLYDKTGNGMHYNTALGRGYSPDYSDETFREYHDRAIRALAEYCNRDGFVSFIQLGSLGHWGEWHAASKSGKSLMPDAQICSEYASLYAECFTNAKLMTRRNYSFAVEKGMGFYNDMIGTKPDSFEWLGWLKNGGSQETSGNNLVLTPVTRWGRTEPVGGEFTSSISMEELLKEDIGTVLETVSESGQTFIGPMVPDLNDKKYELEVQSVLRRMGYRIYVSHLRTRYDFAQRKLNVQLTFRNAGEAGFFFDWPVSVCIYDKDRNLISKQPVSIDLRDLNTNYEIEVMSFLPINDELRKEFYLGVEVKDPDSDNYVTLAIDTSSEEKEFIDGVQLIYHYIKK